MAKKAGWIVGAVLVLPLLLGGVALGLGKLLPGYGLAAVNTPAALPDQRVAEALFPGGIQLRGLRSETVAVRDINDISYNASFSHEVHVNSVQMAEQPISLAQYDVFTKATHRKPLSPSQIDRSRAAEVSDWQELQAFLVWLSATTHQHFRLPTSAEWQLAMGLRTRERCQFDSLNTAPPECQTFDKNDRPQLAHNSDWEWTADCVAESNPHSSNSNTSSAQNASAPINSSTRVACNRHLWRSGMDGVCWFYTQCQFLTLPSNSIKTAFRVVLEESAP